MPHTDRRLTETEWEGVGDAKAYDLALINKAKRRARQDLDLNLWMRQGHAYNSGSTVEPASCGHIEREQARELTGAAFVERYERPNLPVVIDGCAEDWPAMRGAWEPARLFAAYRHRRFRCGEDDDGYPVKMKLKYFLRYMNKCRDDSPMYVFDSMYNDDKTPADLLHDYNVPSYFKEDLFSLVGEHRRPPYRWMLIGPKRSGTGVHIDPLATSAWNTLLYGRKRWVLFPPCFTRAEVKGKELVRKDAGEDDEAIDYFTTVLPRLKKRLLAQIQAAADGTGGVTVPGPSGAPVTYAARPPLVPATAADPWGGLVTEFTQYPGETVFVPGGWWHAVMNIDDTIAVTQNFCSSSNFCRVWPAARDGRKGMARKWLRALRVARPDLAAEADQMNAPLKWNPGALSAAHKHRKMAKFAKRKARAIARAEAKASRKAARKSQHGSSSDSSDSDSDSDSSSSDTSSSGSVTSASSRSTGKPSTAANSTVSAKNRPAARKHSGKALEGGLASSSEERENETAVPAAKRKR